MPSAGSRDDGTSLRVVSRKTVTVGRDGNGAVATVFPAPSKSGRRYVLVVHSGCGARLRSTGPCPPAVDRLQVVLNGDIVFESSGEVALQHVALPGETLRGDEDNHLSVTAGGVPGAVARVAVVAVSKRVSKPDCKRDDRGAPLLSGRLVKRNRLTVRRDGNAAVATVFPAPPKRGLRYVLVVHSGAGCGPRREASPPAVDRLQVTVNEQVVFESSGKVALQHVALPGETLRGDEDNRLLVTAGGVPGAVARVAVVAVSKVTSSSDGLD
jgi:hypothetical protein